MKIILNQDVQDLGEEGDVRDVARGYARNFLFRKGLAVPYNKQNIAIFEHKRTAIDKRKEEKRLAAAGLKERIESLKLEMIMPAGTTGKLFGSVTAAAIAEEMEKNGINIEKKKIDISGGTIKMTGDHTISIRLYEDEVAQCQISIVAEDRGSSKKAKADVPKEKEKEESVEEADTEEAVSEAAPDEADSDHVSEEDEAEQSAEEVSEEQEVAEDEPVETPEEDAVAEEAED